MMPRHLHKAAVRRSPFLLLEVMIAFGILALSAIPLVYPHLMILKEERALIHELEMDFAAQNLIGDLLVELHENRVPFRLIEDAGAFELAKTKWVSVGIPEEALERAFVSFEEKHKPKEPSSSTLYIVKAALHLVYAPAYKERAKRSEMSYPFSFIVLRKLPQTGSPSEGNKKEEGTDETE